jgi:cyclohexanecarboxyl-CoA dehydrogenase
MEFRFSDEEEDLRSAVSDFVQKEVVEKEFNRLGGVPGHIVRQMSDLGFFSLKIPAEYGGESASWVDIGILVEETAKGDIGLAFFTMLSYEVNLLLCTYGQKQIIEKWVPELVSGKKLGCISLTEPQAGCDLTAMKTVAVKRDGDFYLISGEKCPVSFGMQADCTIFFSPIITEADAIGITAFFVPLDLPGITKFCLPTSGLLSSTPAFVTFDKVRVPAVYRLGEEGQGQDINKRFGLFSDFSQILCALASIGLGQAALKLAVTYSKKRTAFGRPIGQFQAISGRIAEAATFIEAGRWLCYNALYLKDQNRPNTKQAAMCGWWCPRSAYRIIEDALLIHGHSGYSDDHPFQQMLRDILAFEMIPGTGQMLKLLVAEDVIGTAAIPNEMAGTVGRHMIVGKTR